MKQTRNERKETQTHTREERGYSTIQTHHHARCGETWETAHQWIKCYILHIYDIKAGRSWLAGRCRVSTESAALTISAWFLERVKTIHKMQRATSCVKLQAERLCVDQTYTTILFILLLTYRWKYIIALAIKEQLMEMYEHSLLFNKQTTTTKCTRPQKRRLVQQASCPLFWWLLWQLCKLWTWYGIWGLLYGL